MNHQHLMTTCMMPCSGMGCDDSVRQAPSGAYFITMGHPGFNSRANNAQGYKTYHKARRALWGFGHKTGVR
jgi:hypothetical protein